jgi:geranylgeranyl pyrophosphate synthase
MNPLYVKDCSLSPSESFRAVGTLEIVGIWINYDVFVSLNSFGTSHQMNSPIFFGEKQFVAVITLEFSHANTMNHSDMLDDSNFRSFRHATNIASVSYSSDAVLFSSMRPQECERL